ncbi:Hypothetical_protein [Hexamita inflata]|uniref:Hypothetical_protein n=1 Tax=Hexamita inflata TaxID=28002 RepID=A0AA86QZY6_9EUKA|nr:Hypothetical protein HINF_LOCUS50544 [Hexamita inflata]
MKRLPWGEKHSEIDVEKPSTNRFASLADSDVQFKSTDSYGKIFDYLHEKGMMKVATQSLIKEVQTKKKPDKPTKTKVIPNAKGNDKKIQSLQEKIAKLQRELQSQFDTTATVMRKFKETQKKHDDKKITQRQTMPLNRTLIEIQNDSLNCNLIISTHVQLGLFDNKNLFQLIIESIVFIIMLQ